MSRTYETGKHDYRPVPCPSYEITKTEAWLTDLAKEPIGKIHETLHEPQPGQNSESTAAYQKGAPAAYETHPHRRR